jgi:hypothetical protein
MTTMIQDFVKQAVANNPEAAAREIPEIIEHYITDNTRLNRVYQAAKAVISQIEKGNLVDDHGHDFNRNASLIRLRQAVVDVEQMEII